MNDAGVRPSELGESQIYLHGQVDDLLLLSERRSVPARSINYLVRPPLHILGNGDWGCHGSGLARTTNIPSRGLTNVCSIKLKRVVVFTSLSCHKNILTSLRYVVTAPLSAPRCVIWEVDLVLYLNPVSPCGRYQLVPEPSSRVHLFLCNSYFASLMRKVARDRHSPVHVFVALLGFLVLIGGARFL